MQLLSEREAAEWHEEVTLSVKCRSEIFAILFATEKEQLIAWGNSVLQLLEHTLTPALSLVS